MSRLLLPVAAVGFVATVYLLSALVAPVREEIMSMRELLKELRPSTTATAADGRPGSTLATQEGEGEFITEFLKQERRK